MDKKLRLRIWLKWKLLQEEMGLIVKLSIVLEPAATQKRMMAFMIMKLNLTTITIITID